MKATFLIALIISTASGVQLHSHAKATRSAPASDVHPVVLAQLLARVNKDAERPAGVPSMNIQEYKALVENTIGGDCTGDCAADLAKNFNAMDTDSSGWVTISEYEAFITSGAAAQ